MVFLKVNYIDNNNEKSTTLLNTNEDDLLEFKYFNKVYKIIISNYDNYQELPKGIFDKFINVKKIVIEELITLTQLDENIFKYNTNLKEIKIIYTGIKDLPENIFKYNVNLKTIFIKHVCFTKYYKNLLKGLNKLENLTLGSNIDNLPMYIEKGFFNNLPHLKNIKLDGIGFFIYDDNDEIIKINIKYGYDSDNEYNCNFKKLLTLTEYKEKITLY